MTSHLMSPREIVDVSIIFLMQSVRDEFNNIPAKFKVLNISHSEIMRGGRNPPPPVKSTLQKPGINRVKSGCRVT